VKCDILSKIPWRKPVSLTRQDVKRIAHLARLQIDEQDIPGYVHSLSEILALVEQMNRVNTDGLEPMAHPQETSQRLRPDEITEPDQRARFQSIAPHTEGGLYLVPRVIE
jgi:aspartyl-tRNA(Asn)/glutamyl-tRNA(Gln) amidotransferase subunit C